MLYVTHDQVEAMTLADRILVLSDHGTVEQVGTPVELYLHPANLFVAQFIGSPSMNILPATLSSDHSNYTISVGAYPTHPAPKPLNGNSIEGDISLGIRAEDFELTADTNALISGNVVFIEILGDATQLHVRIEGIEQNIIVKTKGIAKVHRNEAIHLTAGPYRMHLFDKEGLLIPIESDARLEQDMTALIKNARHG